MAKAKELKEKAQKMREKADLAKQKAKEAKDKKSKDAEALKEAADKAEKDAAAAEAKCAAESENEEAGDGDGEDSSDGDGDDGDDDADQDKKLIKKMIDEYLGDKSKDMSKEEMEAVEKLAHEAYQGHKELGKKEEEAYQNAGEAIKLAKHMASKQKASESDGDDEGHDSGKDPKPKPKDKPAPKDDGDGDDDESENESENQESAREKELGKKLLEAEGRITALESKLKTVDVESYIETQLKKSGQPNAVTKRFREKAGKIKSKEDFDSKWSLFEGALSHSRNDLDWGILAEKSTSTDAPAATGSKTDKLNFSECAE